MRCRIHGNANMHIETAAKPRLSIVVICFGRFDNLEMLGSILVGSARPDWQVSVLFSCGARRAPAELSSALTQRGIKVLLPDQALSIGRARAFALEQLNTEFISFLDDDCFPTPNWFTALADGLRLHPEAGMFFGPRLESAPYALGGYIRKREAQASSKMRLMRQAGSRGAFIVNPNALCAGGNMTVNAVALRQAGYYDPHFEGKAFEDVDFQLSLMQARREVVFSTRMVVRHQDPIESMSLLRKSIRSGRGIVAIRSKYGDSFSRLTRWASVPWLLYRPLLMALLLIGIALCPRGGWLLLSFAAVLAAELAGWVRQPQIAWLTLKPIRDGSIVMGMCLERLLAPRRIPSPLHQTPQRETTS
ncbi:glycosyltransferase family 2 protein [Burkholderia gladioli]|uniref:glycosyltransferase family 2 protein n=2 Tax=Burkholderia gladioli TaxID=28095 RepID=UPI000BBD3F92|nr:hypothetical protein CO712_22240 [Burkholderia gladioli pv. gladioli]